MGTEGIDLIIGATGLPGESRQLVEVLQGAAKGWTDLPYLSIHSVTRRPGDMAEALEGIFRHHDERFKLSPPVDWWEEPYQGANERGFFQNSFVFADPLLADPEFERALVPLASVFADWLGANPQTQAVHPHRYAWHDHAAAGRVVPMSFVLREGVRHGLLDQSTAETLAAGVLEHVGYLLAEENYAAHNNHGFASDAAVALAARNLAPSPPTADWAEIAERRFAAVLDHMIDRDEGIHLEHSPAYHWTIRGALRRFAAGGLFPGLDLEELTEKMADAGSWLAAPDGTLPPIGDTSMRQRLPRPVEVASGSHTGMAVFPAAGYAAVRDGTSALIVTAAHHPTAHKHADDGSFCLYENGGPIVLDSGCPGYEYDSPEFAYGISPAAHATVSVDGFDWAKEGAPYGSGLLASAQRGHLYALLTRNPHAVPGGGAARRVLVYAPTRFLLVIDDVEATSEHQLLRHLPLAPGLDARETGGGGVEIRHGDSSVALLVQIPVGNEPLDDIAIAFGARQPSFQGFRFITPEEPCASNDITLSGPGGQPRAFALLLNPPHDDMSPSMTWDSSEAGVDMAIAGLTDSTLAIRMGDDSIDLEPDR